MKKRRRWPWIAVCLLLLLGCQAESETEEPPAEVPAEALVENAEPAAAAEQHTAPSEYWTRQMLAQVSAVLTEPFQSPEEIPMQQLFWSEDLSMPTEPAELEALAALPAIEAAAEARGLSQLQPKELAVGLNIRRMTRQDMEAEFQNLTGATPSQAQWDALTADALYTWCCLEEYDCYYAYGLLQINTAVELCAIEPEGEQTQVVYTYEEDPTRFSKGVFWSGGTLTLDTDNKIQSNTPAESEVMDRYTSLTAQAEPLDEAENRQWMERLSALPEAVFLTQDYESPEDIDLNLLFAANPIPDQPVLEQQEISEIKEALEIPPWTTPVWITAAQAESLFHQYTGRTITEAQWDGLTWPYAEDYGWYYGTAGYYEGTAVFTDSLLTCQGWRTEDGTLIIAYLATDNTGIGSSCGIAVLEETEDGWTFSANERFRKEEPESSATLAKMEPVVIPTVGGPLYYELILLQASEADAANGQLAVALEGDTAPVYRAAERENLPVASMDALAQQYAALGGTEITESQENEADGILWEKQYTCENGMLIYVGTDGSVSLHMAAEAPQEEDWLALCQENYDRYGQLLGEIDPVFRLSYANVQPSPVILNGAPDLESPLRDSASISYSDGTASVFISCRSQELGEKLGTYPVISMEAAVEKLLAGEGMTESDGPMPDITEEDILDCYVGYYGGENYGTDVYQPVYVFLVEVPDDIAEAQLKENGVSQELLEAWESGAYLVCRRYFIPAVDPAYFVTNETES